MAKSVTELKVGHLYRFGSDSIIRVTSLISPGWGQVIGPRGPESSSLPLEPCIDSIGEEMICDDDYEK